MINKPKTAWGALKTPGSDVRDREAKFKELMDRLDEFRKEAGEQCMKSMIRYWSGEYE